MKNLLNNIIYGISSLWLLLIAYSCDDFVEIDQPNSQLTLQAVFEDPTTATAAMTDIYSQMRENGIMTGRTIGYSCLSGVYSDELISFESDIYSTAPFYTNSLLASNTTVESIWKNTYSQIYSANAIIEGVTNSSRLQTEIKNQLKGEALFVRALLHFYLVNMFGDIPYVMTTDYNQNNVVSRTPTLEVYQKLKQDLEESINLLGVAYITTDRTRPNKATAQALLARVYLYNGNYSDAVNMSTIVLNNSSMYVMESNLENTFLKSSSSTIWQFSPGASGANTYEGTTYIFLEGPPNKVSLLTDFVSQFNDNDLRKAHWIKGVTNGSETWYHAFKYKQNNNSGSSVEYSILFRIEEQYLIRAEAKVKTGDIAGACEDLNKIRNRVGLPNVEVTSQEELLDAILQERKFEFFTEFGHRFFDLKRFGKLDEALVNKPGWNSTDKLWPIPISEILINPNLNPQNPGY